MRMTAVSEPLICCHGEREPRKVRGYRLAFLEYVNVWGWILCWGNDPNVTGQIWSDQSLKKTYMWCNDSLVCDCSVLLNVIINNGFQTLPIVILFFPKRPKCIVVYFSMKIFGSWKCIFMFGMRCGCFQIVNTRCWKQCVNLFGNLLPINVRIMIFPAHLFLCK